MTSEIPEKKYELYGHAFQSRAYEIYAKMRASDPIICQPGIDGQTPIWFFTRYADVERVLLDTEHFSRDPERVFGPQDQQNQLNQLLNNHMLNRDGDAHRRLRGLVSKAFTPKRVQALRPRVEAIAGEMLDRLHSKGEMDLMADFAFHLPTIVIAEMLGIPPEDRDKFQAWSNAFVTPALTEEAQREAGLLLTEFVNYLGRIFEARRQDPKDDLLTALLSAEEAGDRLSEEELYSTMVLLLVAGHETTVSLIGNALLALFQYPEQRRALQEDPSKMPAAVEEFLRFDGSVERALNRWVVKDLAFEGHTLHKGDIVIAILGAGGHDPKIFGQPETLDIGRSPNPHLGFGKGIHYCLGAPLARQETEIALNTLFKRMPDIGPAVEIEQLEWMPAPTFRRLRALPVRWTP